MHIIGVIPSRMGSTRFPGKPLQKISGIPMLGHVYARSAMSTLLERVVIATCDKEIMEYAASIGAPAVMTNNTHERCTDRTAEALLAIEKETGTTVDIVVMIQGDEPMVTPAMIDAAVRPLLDDPTVLVSNLMAPLRGPEEHDDPNEPKVVCDRNGHALYFSREAIPSRWKGSDVPMHKQVCIIPFRRDFLLTFTTLPQTPLEKAESIDMLRILEHGYRITMVPSPSSNTYSVDTPEDLRVVEAAMRGDVLLQQYQSVMRA